MSLFFFVSTLFFACYEQMFSSFSQHHMKMDCVWGAIAVSPTQLRAIQPFLVIILTPLARTFIIPFLAKYNIITSSLSKFRTSFIFFMLTFGYLILTESLISKGVQLSFLIDLVLYFFSTFGEIFVFCIFRIWYFKDQPKHRLR